MHKVLFIISHEGSGSNDLCNLLKENARIEVYNPNLIFSHPFDLNILTGLPHKCNNVSAIWGAELLHNFYINSKSFYKICKFIYLIRNPRSTFNELIKSKKQFAPMYNYYIFRIRRIYEMARASGGVLLTWEDLANGKGLRLIEDYLYLKDGLKDFPVKIPEPNNHVGNIENASKLYEKYLFRLRKRTNGLTVQNVSV